MKTFELGEPGPMREGLMKAVLSGRKTATSSLLAEWQRDGEALPVVGERQEMVDSSGRGVAIVEIVGVETIAIGDVDLRLAEEEGEGFKSVADWRARTNGSGRAAFKTEIESSSSASGSCVDLRARADNRRGVAPAPAR
jgi:uncharacterized protein YhfF